ncbi:hypothetical protein [Actinophytocola oryzae]|uniref:WXG100 family type VII secretion target n=1 Tax=Actinophytocola oryzae TaxID=502181 RepID=A0A4R7UNM8_9PSEU|nr:hypothetical protein [Actinophytocola oryzae]TDV34601.1 hypothetical protein CLV71_13816 [Actinophytocola oryzae]
MSITGADIPGLIAAARRLSDDTDALGENFEKLRDILMQHWGCWGDDEQGKQFADNYVPNCESFMDQVSSAIDDLKVSAADVGSIPGQLQGMDTQNGENVRK